jgi:2-dehydro-3-deoxygluconokinase
MSEAPDLITLGETMLSLVAADGTIDDATSFRPTYAGAESNACVAAVRAGVRAAWVSRLGADPTGDRIIAALEAVGIDVRWVRRDPDRPTGLMIRDTHGGVRYWRHGSAASALEPSDLDGVPIAVAEAVLVTGITALLGDGPQRTAVVFLDRATGIRAVDPHVRPGLWGSDRSAELLGSLLERCDVLLAGEGELARLLGTSDLGEALARRAQLLGPAEVILKRGSEGAAVLMPDGGWLELRPPPVVEVDPVGAGDAFNGAYLAARIRGADVPDALAAGCASGAMVAGTMGDTEPSAASGDRSVLFE